MLVTFFSVIKLLLCKHLPKKIRENYVYLWNYKVICNVSHKLSIDKMSPKTIIVDVMFHFVHNITKIVLIKNLEIIQKKRDKKKKKFKENWFFFFKAWARIFIILCAKCCNNWKVGKTL
jgi:hypothetical protein